MTHRWVQRILVMAVLGGLAAPVLAQQGECTDATTVLREAQKTFDNGHLPQVLTPLKKCQELRWPQWNKSDRVNALRLMAISYHFTREVELAEATVTDMLKVDSGYDLRREDPVFFREMVVAEKENRKARLIKNLKIGGGIAALSVGIGYLLFRAKPLPEPSILLPPR